MRNTSKMVTSYSKAIPIGKKSKTSFIGMKGVEKQRNSLKALDDFFYFEACERAQAEKELKDRIQERGTIEVEAIY